MVLNWLGKNWWGGGIDGVYPIILWIPSLKRLTISKDSPSMETKDFSFGFFFSFFESCFWRFSAGFSAGFSVGFLEEWFDSSDCCLDESTDGERRWRRRSVARCQRDGVASDRTRSAAGSGAQDRVSQRIHTQSHGYRSNIFSSYLASFDQRHPLRSLNHFKCRLSAWNESNETKLDFTVHRMMRLMLTPGWWINRLMFLCGFEGRSGLGKSTLINTLFRTAALPRESDPSKWPTVRATTTIRTTRTGTFNPPSSMRVIIISARERRWGGAG